MRRTMPQSVQRQAPVGPIAEPGSLDAGRRTLDLDLDLDLDGRTSSDTAPSALEVDPAVRPTGAGHRRRHAVSRSTCRGIGASRRPCRRRPRRADDALDFDLGELTLDDRQAGRRVARRRRWAPTTTSPRRCRPVELSDDDADPLARKLELAEEFRQIGDMEGARDLLEEVVAKADGALKAKAQGMLDSLS